MTSSKAEFWEIANRPKRDGSVEIDGKSFRLREMSEAEAAELEVKLQDKSGKIDWTKHRRLVVHYCLVDADGNRIVDKPDDLASVGKSLISRLYEKACHVNDYIASELEELSLAKKSSGADGAE
jgi:hypothetical protein